MKRNVILLILDTVRKDYFDKYAQNIKSISDISFDNAFAASSWSTPSHASILTGKLPHQHGVHANSLSFKNLDREETFLSDLNNFQKIGTSTNVFAGPEFGFDSLFDHFLYVSRNGGITGGLDMDTFSRTTDSVGIHRYWRYLFESWKKGVLLRSAINGTTAKIHDITRSINLPRLWDYGAQAIVSGSKNEIIGGSEPFFFFANFMEAHSPYEDCLLYDRSISQVPRGWSNSVEDWEINAQNNSIEDASEIENRRRIYSGAVDYLDRIIAPFVEALIEQTSRDTTVIITSDHGEALEHSDVPPKWGHVGSLSHSLLHVPLEIINPPDDYSPETEALFSHLDLAELITAFSQDQSVSFNRSVVPAERIGLGVSQDVGPADYDYWNRGIRCIYEQEKRIEWDTLGEVKEFNINGPSREQFSQPLNKLPDLYREMFDAPINQYKNDNVLNTADDLSESVKEGLEDLGYL
ncbi:sulfatase-like hydrolase/transferase [Halobellus sp. H-GB7]|uniref:sulfatase-like hydrolase/transferase n=1 Tax=Halobellus sp. H-GB7 TaxID=3069756 RepID=UPI0027B69065|nr:sulfatase-like hydrolase/transferase [Halobellus sp. H-GB7]MDQ2056441.1 sulfatase-like hydrolase/transferase [Halobellus sp. H-GB7]